MEILSHLFDSYFSSVVLVILAFALCWKLWNTRPHNSPPGSNGIPLLGVLLSMSSFPERVMQKWSKIYGPLFMVKFAWKNVVVINSPEIAYEAFAKSDYFNDRPKSLPLLDGGLGIVMVNRTDFHKEQRRFGLNTLRGFGMGRRSLEPRLFEISSEICEKLDGFCGTTGESKPFDISRMMYKMTSSIIAIMIFGQDIAKHNKEFDKFITILTTDAEISAIAQLLFIAPVLRYLPVFSAFWAKNIQIQQAFNNAINKDITAHQKSIDRNNPRDFIDCFLNQIEKASENIEESEKNTSERDISFVDDECEEKTDFSRNWKRLSSFHSEQLTAIVRDLFIAGTDTTATTLNWIIFFLSKYTDVQKKLQQEIDDVIGQSGVPRMSMMEKLPYTRAVIQEVMRIRPITTLSVPHMSARDAKLVGYEIPKGTVILTNIWAIHHDETRWPEPDKFLPERHLDENGRFVTSPNIMAFSVGARSCLGQQLAKMELFLSTLTLFQKFHFRLPAGSNPDMNGFSSVTLRPTKFELIISRR